MGFKCQSKFSLSSLTHFSSRNNTNHFSLPIEQNTPNPLHQDTPVPCNPCQQTPWQPTPSPSGTQWSEDLFCSKQKAIPFLILSFDSSELALPPFVEPSQYNEPPIPGSSPSLNPHEDLSACEPEPEVALKHSLEEPFVIIYNMPFGSPPPPPPCLILNPSPPVPSSSTPTTDPSPETLPLPPRTQPPSPLIPTMGLGRNLPTYNQP
ncbi:hypothetical protein O181_041660 [Austropuccinia psidii MF-1]|uniref:Uncharacterized protein n=1 Tax=Austropuccinia psidii MF-1 TaxID=1389203 RepID=A0A9Q3DF99_9BASI|nr:hypothetical protein [Austropuccinia psidii MF-1]